MRRINKYQHLRNSVQFVEIQCKLMSELQITHVEEVRSQEDISRDLRWAWIIWELDGIASALCLQLTIYVCSNSSSHSGSLLILPHQSTLSRSDLYESECEPWCPPTTHRSCLDRLVSFVACISPKSLIEECVQELGVLSVVVHFGGTIVNRQVQIQKKLKKKSSTTPLVNSKDAPLQQKLYHNNKKTSKYALKQNTNTKHSKQLLLL